MSESKGTKNIGGGSNDPFYRYKRSIIEVTYSKKKGGTSTITNMDTIQNQLKMPIEFVAAFYKKIKKTGKAMTSPGVFRGKLDIAFFEGILDAMISKYVLCPKCTLPELVQGVCQACGHS